MKAKDISGRAPGGKRTKLADVLPLATPFVIQIFPIYACTFKCNYCIFSLAKNERHFISDKVMMDFNLYKKCIDEIAQFPDKIKVLRFVGIGEPLLHKDIINMIGYANECKVAHTIEILTNAFLLTPQISDALVAVGLTRLVVSLQGTTKEKYQKIGGVDIDLENFIKNLRYFFEHRNKVHVYFKIVDSALDGKEDEQRYYQVYGDLCDTMAIEYAVPIHAGIDYDQVLKRKGHQVTQFGLPIAEVKICPQPFFHMQINPDGKVVPCYSFEYPAIMGDCNNESVCDIWNGETFRNFRRTMLDGAKCVCETCANCNIIKYRMFPEDVLNNDIERLKKFYR